LSGTKPGQLIGFASKDIAGIVIPIYLKNCIPPTVIDRNGIVGVILNAVDGPKVIDAITVGRKSKK